MTERPDFAESFATLNFAANELRKYGWHFFPIPKEHAEATLTEPLISRLRAQIKRRGFSTLAGRSIITFSGYAADQREIWGIPETRSYWRQLDQGFDELPSLLGALPAFGYNGPSMHVSLLGEIDLVVDHPERRQHHLHVIGAERIIAKAVERIHRVGRKYHLPTTATVRLISDFMAMATSLG